MVLGTLEVELLDKGGRDATWGHLLDEEGKGNEDVEIERPKHEI